ncbi:unnamed protein product [Tuber aestivum]|uniref:Laccase n=1 Tax=Tuber aestivum TaxID=59557 RepID=A0A292PYD3_9PEZI|nr:unnamed protein product [Tuber aestivum]
MELLKFLLHIVRTFGLLGHESGDLDQEILDAGGLLPDLPSIGGANALVPSANFECPNYSPGGIEENLTSCNTPSDRSCWFEPNEWWAPSGYGINTDYEFSWPDGTHREYWLEVTDGTTSPDGYLKTKAKLVNGTYPGPLLEACWGDQLTIHVTNKMTDNGTTIHWHGFRQWNSSEADGVNATNRQSQGVTQCPIAPGSTYTYKFRATEYGHTWYHSHYSLQYPDGVLGPIIIHGPQSANYDEDVGTVLISDWSHETAFIDFFKELTDGPPPMQSNLLQGRGRFPCVQGDPRCVGAPANYYELKFEKGKKYLLRLINTSTASQFKFSIDNHNLTVVSADFVPIQPYQTQYLNIGIGQRYSVIVEANPSGTDESVNMDYWIRTIPAVGCNSIQFPVVRTGIVRYFTNSSYALPVSTFWKTQVNQTAELDDCDDEDMKNLVPVVPKSLNPGDYANNYTSDTYEVGMTEPTTQNPMPHGNYSRWDIAMLPMWLEWGNPIILNLDKNVSTLSPELAIVPEDYQNAWIVLVIVGNLTLPSGHNVGKQSIPTRHPIHLHGHDFVLLAQNDTEWDTPTWTAADAFNNMNYNNPPRRDVALLPKEGYIVIAFKTDNPGPWLIHCHIAWHASSGLAMQIMEDQENIERTIKDKQAIQDTCDAWNTWNATMNVEQDDSGI